MKPKIQIIIGNQYNPHLNLAVESHLLDEGDPDVVTMFLWKNQQTVVYGYNQNPFTECNVELLLSEGGYAARRRTGGGADKRPIRYLMPPNPMGKACHLHD